MSICPKCSGVCLCKILSLDDKIAEINEVIGKLDLKPDLKSDLKPLKISDRVCQTPRWRRAASATRWSKN